MSVAHLCVFFGKMSIQILYPFLIGLLGFLLLNCMILFVLVPYQIHDLQLFSLVQWISLLVVLIVSFTVQKFFSLIPSHLFIFAFVALGVRFKQSLPRPIYQGAYSLCFLLGI